MLKLLRRLVGFLGRVLLAIVILAVVFGPAVAPYWIFYPDLNIAYVVSQVVGSIWLIAVIVAWVIWLFSHYEVFGDKETRRRRRLQAARRKERRRAGYHKHV